jgi:hypothetical protein
MFPRERLNYNNEERCFLRGPCQGVINGTSLEFSQWSTVDFSIGDSQKDIPFLSSERAYHRKNTVTVKE